MRFISKKYRNLRVILKPGYREVVNGMPRYVSGKSVEFRDGYLDTEDKEVIELLKASPSYGSQFISDSGEAEVNVMAENAKKEAVAKADPLACPYCDFVAKNESGLRLHIRIHE